MAVDCCFQCGKLLSIDEMGLHRKLVNRGAKEFLCISCLGKYFHCSEELLKEKIEYFRNTGCVLFPKKESIIDGESISSSLMDKN